MNAMRRLIFPAVSGAGGRMPWLYWNRLVDDCLRSLVLARLSRQYLLPKLATEVASPSGLLAGGDLA